MPNEEHGGAVTAVVPRTPSGRRGFLAAAGGAIAAFPMIAAARETTVLRLHGAWPAKDIRHEYALDFAKKINDMAGARLRVDVYPAGSTVKPKNLQDAVHRGVIDGCHAVPGFWHERNAAYSLFGAGPALGMDANAFLGWMRYGGGLDLYYELIHRQNSLNVVPFLTGPMPAQPLGWFRKPLTSPAGLKGLRVRAYGLAAELFREMGARPVEVAEEDVAAAAKRGEIDAAATNNPSTDLALGVADVLKVCMLRSHHLPAEVLEVLIHRAKFDALPAELQAVIRHVADAASADLSWKALHRYPEDQARLQGIKGVQFRRTPKPVLRAQLQAWEKVIARHAPTNPLFDRILRSQKAWARRSGDWLRETAADPLQARDFWFAGRRGKAAE